MSFKRTGRPLERPTSEATAWAHDPKSVRQGSAFVPAARSLSSWARVGEVASIDYTRHGEHADKYVHEFDGRAVLYRKGQIYRLELGQGAEFNWRGFVRP